MHVLITLCHINQEEEVIATSSDDSEQAAFNITLNPIEKLDQSSSDNEKPVLVAGGTVSSEDLNERKALDGNTIAVKEDGSYLENPASITHTTENTKGDTISVADVEVAAQTDIPTEKDTDSAELHITVLLNEDTQLNSVNTLEATSNNLDLKSTPAVE